MPGCPSCGKLWPDHFQRCPEDGAALMHQGGPSVSGAAAPAFAFASDEDLPAGSFAGEYRIEKKIGEGGMGSVYGARHPLIGKRAAIKVIRRELSNSREAVDRFVLEAQSVNQIGHPNIVDVFGFGQLPDGRAFFVMEWLEGESLRERLQRPLQFPEALEMLEAIAKALQAAHDAGVVHRDLKPDNVYLQRRKGEKEMVKLLDFGLAKLTGQGDGRMDRTRTGVVMGTPMYLSPEQAKGGKIDAATDVYSLGAMGYEMLAGVVPFKADSAVEIMAMHISQPALPLVGLAPWVPPEIEGLILQMLEKDAQRRPTTAEVRERIAACRSRASQATLGMAMNPSSQPPPWTPAPGMHTPAPGMHTPAPGMHTPGPGMYTPPVGTHPPSATPYTVGQSAMSQPTGGSKKLVVVAVSALAAIGLAVGLYLAVANKKSEQVASNEPTKVEPAKVLTPPADPPKADPPKTDPVAAPPPTEPAKVDPPPADPVTTPPTDPVKTDPVKIDPKKPIEATKRGRVNIVFDGPAKALIIVDGKPQGRETGGRVTLELAPGDHTVRVQAKGFKPADTKIHVEAGGSRDVKLTLEKRQNVNSVHDPFAD